MSLITALATTAAVAAGTAGAVTAYQLAAPEPTVAPAIESTDQGTRPDRPRFEPCAEPATLEKGKCVTSLTRTVVVAGTTLGAAVPGGSGVPVPDGDGTPDQGDDARRDVDDDELVAVADDDWDDDVDTGGTNTGTHTGTNTSTGGSGSGTSTRTRTGG
jgi:hypothetical protein